MFGLAAAFSLGWVPPEPTWAQMVFWQFNMPCLLAASWLSGNTLASWQSREYTLVWVVQPVVLLVCAVINTGFWFWLGAQWEGPGERVTWWRRLVSARRWGFCFTVGAWAGTWRHLWCGLCCWPGGRCGYQPCFRRAQRKPTRAIEASVIQRPVAFSLGVSKWRRISWRPGETSMRIWPNGSR